MSKGRITSKKQATLRITSEWQETDENLVETVGHESHTCRVAIDTIEADGCITGRVAQEVNTLIRVG